MFRQIIMRNYAVFKTSDHPLGRTSLVVHVIITMEPGPIKQRVRRPPVHLWGEAEQTVQDMLNDNVVEPSTSPWVSTVVLIRIKGEGKFALLH